MTILAVDSTLHLVPPPPPWKQPLITRRHLRIYYGDDNAQEEEGSGVRPSGGHSKPEEYGASGRASRPFVRRKVVFLCPLVRESVWMCDRRVFTQREIRVY